jgi:hypothetical protein
MIASLIRLALCGGLLIVANSARAEMIRTAVPRASLNYLSIYVAEAKGFFKDEGLEPRLAIRPEAFQAILDDVAQIDTRAKKIKPADFIDGRFLDEMTRSGFFDKLWAEKSL